MKKYIMNNFCIQCFGRMPETPVDTQELQYPSDFSTTSSSSALDDSENV